MRDIILKILSTLLIFTSLISCGVDPLTGEDSPDKSKTLLTYIKRIGDKNTYVSIHFKDNKHDEDLLELTGMVQVSVEWVNNKEVNIIIPEKSLIVYSNTMFRDIKVNIIKE